MKTLHTVLVACGLVGALAAAWWVQNRPAAPQAAAVGAGAGGPAATGGAGRPGGPGGPGGAGGAGGPVAVELGLVKRQRLVDEVQAVGTLRPLQGVVLRPEVSGRVVKLGFADGQRVKRGALLVQLDDTLQQAQLKQSEAQAGIARTNLHRSRELLAQGFISQSAVDQNTAALDVAQAQVALAQAQIARMRVLAPFDGLTGIRTVSLGDYVKDGADLVRLDDLSALWAEFRLPERYLSRVRPGQTVDLRLDALPGRTLKATVAALDAQVDADGRALLVRAKVANPDGALRGGMFARAQLVLSVREQALVVPEEALVPQGGKQFVVLAVAGEKGLSSRRVEAKIGQRVEGAVELLDGVAEGDQVVLAGQARLMRADGLPLRKVDLARVGGPGRPGGKPGAGASGPGGPGGQGGPGASAPAGQAGPGGPGAASAPSAAAASSLAAPAAPARQG